MSRAGIERRRIWLCALAPLPVLASNSFATWTLAGLETPLYGANNFPFSQSFSRLRRKAAFRNLRSDDFVAAQARFEANVVPGHQRSDPDYVLSHRPDYIFIPKHDLNTRWRHLPAVLDLWADSRLESLYEWDPNMTAYHRRDHKR